LIGARLKLQRKEDEDEDDKDDDVGDERWGANKKRYYNADTVGMEVRMVVHFMSKLLVKLYKKEQDL
jgi:hypothetical protein